MNVFGYFTVVLISLVGINKREITITGIAVYENQPYPGCQVSLVGTGLSTITNSDGKFSFSLDGSVKDLSINITSPDSATTSLHNIRVGDADLDLMEIPVFHNRFIPAAEYDRLTLYYKLDYKPLRHWADLIGYVHLHEIDTSEVKVACPKNPGSQLPWIYIKKNNMVVIEYADWSSCRQ